MPQQRGRYAARSDSSQKNNPNQSKRVSSRPQSHRFSQEWAEPKSSSLADSIQASLTQLIEHDAPLNNHNSLVLMYGPFQAAMSTEQGQGVATWLRECICKHGFPSLMRFDYGRRAQIFRRDQIQVWLEPLLVKHFG